MNFVPFPCVLFVPRSSGGVNSGVSEVVAASGGDFRSVCVIAECWTDYTSGVMSSAACGSSGARYQFTLY